MLFYNETLVELQGKGSAASTRFSEVVSKMTREFANKNGIVIFEFVPELESTLEDEHGRKKSVYPRSISVGCVASVVNPSGTSDMVRYAEAYNHSPQTKAIIYTPQRITLKSRMPVNLNTNADLAYFLYACSPHCANGLNKSSKSSIYFRIKDEKEEARQKIEVNRNVDRARFMISNDDMMGGLSDLRIRVIAKTYGYPNADDGNIMVVRAWVRDYVDKLMRHDKFLVDASVETFGDLQSIVEKLEESGHLTREKRQGKMAWLLDGEDIHTVSYAKDAVGNLVALMEKDEELLRRLRSIG
jgi:hypothetical protein